MLCSYDGTVRRRGASHGVPGVEKKHLKVSFPVRRSRRWLTNGPALHTLRW
jgi:hypothetical protein